MLDRNIVKSTIKETSVLYYEMKNIFHCYVVKRKNVTELIKTLMIIRHAFKLYLYNRHTILVGRWLLANKKQ